MVGILSFNKSWDPADNMDCKEELLGLSGCVVKGNFRGIEEESSACGLILYPEHGIVLSHGSILGALCLKSKTLSSQIDNGQLLRQEDLQEPEFGILIDSRWRTHMPSVRPSLTTNESVENTVHSGKYPHGISLESFTILKCKFIGAFRNNDFHQEVCRIMPDNNWTYDDSVEDLMTNDRKDLDKKELNENNRMCFNLLSYFVVLKTEPLAISSSALVFPKNVSRNNAVLPAIGRHVCTGDVAEIVATPFGGQNPAVFFNSYSRGVVCNVSGSHGCWILTDARCIPGSEGGPLFTRKENGERCLTGIIAASLCWKNKEWVGFSLACSLESVISSLSSHVTRNTIVSRLRHELEQTETGNKKQMASISDKPRRISPGTRDSLLSSTVAVRVGSTWGSGVIVDKDQGIILTCGHVLKDSSSFPIMIKPYQGSVQHEATLIYNHYGQASGPYDIAVLKCPKATAHIGQCEVPGTCIPRVGEKVWVIGHALFSTDLDLQPSACAGVVSKVLRVRGHPVVVQSTCAVHAGVSGGPMLNKDGQLVGIIVCNTVDKGSNSSYPHINMSIPVANIWPAVQEYIRTGDISEFSTFEVKDTVVKKLWALDSSIAGNCSDIPGSKL